MLVCYYCNIVTSTKVKWNWKKMFYTYQLYKIKQKLVKNTIVVVDQCCYGKFGNLSFQGEEGLPLKNSKTWFWRPLTTRGARGGHTHIPPKNQRWSIRIINWISYRQLMNNGLLSSHEKFQLSWPKKYAQICKYEHGTIFWPW